MIYVAFKISEYLWISKVLLVFQIATIFLWKNYVNTPQKGSVVLKIFIKN